MPDNHKRYGNYEADVQKEIDALKDIIAKSQNDDLSDLQIDELKSGRERLMNAAQTLFAKMYSGGPGNQGPTGGPGAGGPGAGGPTGGNGGSGGNDDDVVDADYKEL